MIMNTLNRRAAWRAWPLTKLNVPVKIPGGGGSPPGPSLCYDTEMCSPHRGFVISRVFSICLDYGWSQENRSPRTSSYLYYSNKFMHGFVKFLIVLLRSLLLCFCTVFNVKTIQYNAIHKFVGVLDNPPRLMLSEGWNAIAETLYKIGEHAPGPP